MRAAATNVLVRIANECLLAALPFALILIEFRLAVESKRLRRYNA